MKKLLFSLMMALTLSFAGLVQAQVTLPFTEGFENGLGSWTLTDCESSTGVTQTSSYIHSGSAGFTFYWSYNPPQYLISPEITGATGGLNVEFYYKASSSYWEETFQVGYSTTTNAVSAFTFEPEITATTDWTTYTHSFPAGTKYVAVKCTSYNAFYFCLDDFSFTAANGGDEPGDEPGDDPVVVDGTAPTSVCAEAVVINGDSLVHIWWDINGTAPVIPDPVDPDNMIEDFEDFENTPFEWQNSANYPWTVTTNNPYEGSYCLKSGGAGVANVTSDMSVAVNVPTDGYISFYVKPSCESSYDNGYFFIDGTQKGTFTGQGSWAKKKYAVTAGNHTFKWSYQKDSSVNSNDDCIYIDYINFNEQPEPELPGTTYNFDEGIPSGWTTIDADGDGYTWVSSMNPGVYHNSGVDLTGTGHEGSDAYVLSGSYANGLGSYGQALTPDNYFVSPQVALGGAISFWACAQDEDYAAEHFGVAVSTTNNSSASAFTTIQAWTMTAKGTGAPTRFTRDGGLRQGDWYQYTVDLSAYAGQTGYVAIRHFDCTDEFILNVDDITISDPNREGVANRALTHFRVYRTNCYNDGPYTSENTELLASAWMPDYSYYDVSWPYAEPGVYKYGVSAVYDEGRDDIVEYPALEGESEIVWSDLCGPCIDKDMETQVTVNVVLNSADSPEGTIVSFTNLNEVEQLNYPIYPITLDGTGFYAFDTFRKGEYLVTVYLPGYYPIQEEVSIWEPTDLRYVLIEIIYGVKNLYVSRTGWAMWEPITPADDTINNPFGPDGPDGPGGELTVYDGSATSGYVPVYGFDADQHLKCEMIMPAADLAELPHTNINSLKWELSSTAYYSDSWNGPFKIFMKEVDATTISAYQGMDGATLVYEGPIDAHTDTDIEINFTSPYHYNGGNLLIGVYKEGYQSMVGWGSAYFKGEQRSGASIYGNSSSSFASVPASQGNFLPKTTFTYGNGAKSGEERHLESFKVMCTSIDDQPIWNHNTPFDQPFCQLTTVDMWSGNDMLIEGEYYKVKVCAYYSTGQSVWCEPVIWQYEPCDHWGPVDAVETSTIDAGNHIEWVFEHGHNQWIDFPGGDEPGGDEPGGDEPGGDEPGDDDIVFSDDFENGIAGWTTIDADGDGYDWYDLIDNNPNAIPGHNGSEGFATSASYQSYALTPDNYLVSPQLPLDGTFSFWACGQDASWAAEHFGVAISTTNNTSASAFTTIQEWTLSAKSSGVMTSETRDGQTREQGAWYQFTVDLSSYNGQMGYIAIRHFDCTDMFRINVDDVELSNPAKAVNLAKGSDIYWQYADNGIMLNFHAIENYQFRFYLLYLLSNNHDFVLVRDNEYGKFLVTTKDEDRGLMEEFESLYANAIADFSLMSKVDVANNMGVWKSGCNGNDVTSISMDVIVNGTRLDNDLCINSFPFCAVDGYAFDASFGAASAQENADYGCMYSQPNPAWYHMRIRTAGQFVIHMESHATTGSNSTYDIDFCLWGPFDDPTEPCLSDLTSDKIIDCSWSAAGTEDCYLGYPANQHDHAGSSLADGTINYHVPEVGEYYILLISNYSNQPCNISFVKTEGVGDTDCDIVNPTVDIIGFLVTIDGEYLAIVGPDEREYTDLGEFGEHEYCVRPIYPGPAQLPDTNYYFSMGCPVCMGTTGEIDDSCDPGDPIYAEVDNTEDQVHIWWGNVPPQGETSFTEGFEGGLNGWNVIDVNTDGGTWLHSDNNQGGYDYTELAHGGTGFAMCYSFIDYVGSYDTDSYLYTPQKYDIVNGSTLTFYADNANDDYPESFSVCVATADNPTANDFITVWSGEAKGEGAEKANVRHSDTRYENWRAHSVDLSAYAGQSVYIAFHDVNYDMYEVWIDDVELTPSAKDLRAEIVSYNIYRSTDNENYELIANIPADGGTYYEYFDNPGAGTFYYQVTAVYSDGCESDPTTSGAEPTHNYVVVGVTGVDELADNVNLFPNPTKNNITVQAPGMKRIAVVSVLGQVVFDTQLDASEYTINMGQFNPGMYLVRVYTENGMTVKRVTVMQ